MGNLRLTFSGHRRDLRGAAFKVDTNDQGLPTISLNEEAPTGFGHNDFNAILYFKRAAVGVVNDKTGTGEVSYNQQVTVFDNLGTVNLTSDQVLCKENGTISYNKDYVYFKNSAEMVASGIDADVITKLAQSEIAPPNHLISFMPELTRHA